MAPLAVWATLGRELVRSCQRGGQVYRLYRVCLAIKTLVECRSQLYTSDAVTFASANCFKRSTHDTVAATSHGKRVSHAFEDANQITLGISSQISCQLPRKYMPTSIPSGWGCFESKKVPTSNLSTRTFKTKIHKYMHLYFARSRQSKNKQTRKKQAKNKYIAKENTTLLGIPQVAISLDYRIVKIISGVTYIFNFKSLFTTVRTKKTSVCFGASCS